MAIPRHPALERKPRNFDVDDLARSVIASPLLEQIRAELALTDKILADHPSVGGTENHQHNAAIFLDPEFPGGVGAALAAARDLLPKAEQRAGVQAGSLIDDPDPSIDETVAPGWLEGGLVRTLVGLDSLRKNPAILTIWPTRIEVIIDISLNFKPLHNRESDPRVVAKALIKDYVEEAMRRAGVDDKEQGVEVYKTEVGNQYVFARLQGKVILELVKVDEERAKSMAREANAGKADAIAQALGQNEKSSGRASLRGVRKKLAEQGDSKKTEEIIAAAPEIDASRFRTIHHIWPDFAVRTCITQSVRTVKVDAAQNSFTALGDGITWAVMDTGIDGLHPHFKLHENIDAGSPYHADFTGVPGEPQPLKDDFGHGTHVAGIIAGEQSKAKGSSPDTMTAVWRELDASKDPTKAKGLTATKPIIRKTQLDAIGGMAPKCKLVSLKVLDEFGMGKASNVIAAIAHVQLLNGHGRDLKIHGVNLSLGHSFDPKWFACGHSPLCVEVNRLVKSGVVVVVAAGNTGYGTLQTKEGTSDTCLDLTINDPGNAEYAITVGSTHRDSPHMYGVSYFSSKGPTGDGRCKPDLVAPGEKIISCAAAGSALVQKGADNQDCSYFENSGTSMAAPHVSGAIAAFLSIRGEFVGEAEKVKKIFTSTATDLGRDRYFQGAGLVDLMRAIQSV